MATNRVFELRTYYTAPGKLAALHRRFEEHTLALFAKHGMEVVGFFSPTDEPDRDNTLVYVLAFPDRATADKAWEAFRADPEKVGAAIAQVATYILLLRDLVAIRTGSVVERVVRRRGAFSWSGLTSRRLCQSVISWRSRKGRSPCRTRTPSGPPRPGWICP